MGFRSLLLIQLAALFASLSISTSSLAQRCGSGCSNPEAILGLSERTLVDLYPELKRNSKPIQGPRGGKGRWIIPDVSLGSQIFDGIVYIEASKVVRVEFVSTASQSACRSRAVFTETRDQLEQRYGKSPVTGTYEYGGKSSASVAFASPTVDVALLVIDSLESCSTRVVFKQHEERDASQL